MASDTAHLSRRERQIMEIVYERGRVAAAEVRERMPDPPSYSTRAISRRNTRACSRGLNESHTGSNDASAVATSRSSIKMVGEPWPRA